MLSKKKKEVIIKKKQAQNGQDKADQKNQTAQRSTDAVEQRSKFSREKERRRTTPTNFSLCGKKTQLKTEDKKESR